MKLKKSIALLLTTIFVGGGVLSGCGSNKNEITFWNPFTGGDNENLVAMIEEYNATDPEFKIKNVSMKEGDMYTKISTVVNSGKDIPDLMIVHGERIKQYNDNGMLESFDELLTNYPNISAGNYVEAAWNIGELDGTRYAVPLDIHTWGTYYNVELLAKYAPNALDDEIITFDEIREIAQQASADGIATTAVTWFKPNFMSALSQYGGQLSENGIDPTLDSQASIDAATLLSDLFADGLTPKDGEDATQMFLTGQLVLWPEGIWGQNIIKDAEFEWGLTNAPQLSDDLSETVNWSSSHQFVMFNSEQRTDEKEAGIADFLEWLRTNSIEWARAGQNPASLDIINNEEYKTMPQSIFMSSEEQQATLEIFDYKYNGYVSEYLDGNGPDLYTQKMSVDDFVSGMQKEVSDKIAKDGSN